MPVPAYRAKQSTDTAGTGTIVLNAAGTNARSFAAAYGVSSRRVMYAISWASGFEIGYGDFDGGTPGSLTRATVLASSNAGALVTLPAGTKDVFAVFDPGAREVLAISGTTTLALADLGNAVLFTGASASNLNLPAIATAPLGSGWMVRNAGTAALTIDPSGAETINGAATLVLQAGQAAFIFDGGAAWECIIAGQPVNSAVIADSASGAPVDIASAATTDIGAATSPNVRITGTTGITSFGTVAAGTRRFLAFAAALTLTHNATSLILPGLANITTAAGDTAVARSLGSGNWVVESYTPASGLSMVGQIAFFPANVAPGGWLKANGVLLSRATYAALWTYAQASGNIVSDATWVAASGPTGSFSTGDGSTTFRVPDLRGEFVRAWDDARGVDSGRVIGSYQADALQNHTHEVLDRINSGAGEPAVNGTNAGGSDITRTTTNPVTGRTAAETRPQNFALLACIKF